MPSSPTALYRAPGGGSLLGYGRIGSGPGDRNLLTFYVDSGLAYKGLLKSRPADALGVSVGYAKIGAHARGLDRELSARLPGLLFPLRIRVTHFLYGH